SHNVLAGQSGDAYEINAEFKVSPGSAAEFGFKVRTGENQFTKVGYDRRNAKLFVDRSESGNDTFNPAFNTGKETAPLKPVNGKV
ncbi:GH32 C-terminal domain-containing protein, partial [Enterococcus faecalis]